MSVQTVATLVISTLILLIPSVIGIRLALRGDGHRVWVAAGTALVLTALGLSLNGGDRYSHLVAYIPSILGLLVGVGACIAALIYSLRTRQFAWSVALIAAGMVPLVAALVIYDFTIIVLTQVYAGGPPTFQAERLVFELLAIGSLAPTAYAVRVAYVQPS